MRKITLAISPCPNDTFMFYGLIKNKIGHDLDIDVTFLDIEELNQAALNNTYDVTKISFSLLAKISQNYWLLDHGSALGEGCGPLLISKSLNSISLDSDYHCLIPGKNTTANFLLSSLYPNIKQKEETLFSNIENKLKQGYAHLGLVIHETRFTYAANGFSKISDLGEEWEEKTGLPIPLGGIVASRALNKQLTRDISEAIEASIKYAYANETDALEYCKEYAQEMNTEVMKAHIDLYVNQYSLDLGVKGRQTINYMLKKMREIGLLEQIPKEIFFNI